jgi:L-lysine 2,3-aminomutase
MLPHTLPVTQTTSWQDELSNLIRSPEELFDLLSLPVEQLDAARRACADFPLRVPRPYAARIQPGNLQDPLLLQVMPLGDELISSPGYNNDPLEEADSNPIPGLIHKYQGRVLLIVSPSCAIHCRYCFRRHFPYDDNKPSRTQWQQALDYIAADDSINEVIYSGGDPLSSNDKQLQWLTDQIAAIPHITRLRVHTRLPVMIPQRITDSCLEWLSQTHLKVVMVLHVNHAQELDHEVGEALSKLKQSGVTLLNQAVLLKGINDSVQAQVDLSERLFELGALPYYLHLLDKVKGAAHFDMNVEEARHLHLSLQGQLPGFLVPKLVQEIPGAASKTPL